MKVFLNNLHRWGSQCSYVLQIFNYALHPTGEGNGNPLQCSCLENPRDRGAWWAAIHGVAQSQTQLKWLSMHACIGEGNANPLQYSCLENPRDRGNWWAAIYGVAQSQTRLKQLSSSSSKGSQPCSQASTWLPFYKLWNTGSRDL